MTQNKNWKKKIRARMERTGETYSTARRNLIGDRQSARGGGELPAEIASAKLLRDAYVSDFGSDAMRVHAEFAGGGGSVSRVFYVNPWMSVERQQALHRDALRIGVSELVPVAHAYRELRAAMAQEAIARAPVTAKIVRPGEPVPTIRLDDVDRHEQAQERLDAAINAYGDALRTASSSSGALSANDAATHEWRQRMLMRRDAVKRLADEFEWNQHAAIFDLLEAANGNEELARATIAHAIAIGDRDLGLALEEVRTGQRSPLRD